MPQVFSNVWDALSDTAAEAANMTARSDIMLALQRTVTGWGVTHEVAAQRLGITRPRITDLITGKLGKFSLDALIHLAVQAGLSVELRISNAA